MGKYMSPISYGLPMHVTFKMYTHLSTQDYIKCRKERVLFPFTKKLLVVTHAIFSSPHLCHFLFLLGYSDVNLSQLTKNRGVT